MTDPMSDLQHSAFGADAEFAEEENGLDVMPGRFSILMPRKLFGEDLVIRSGLLQVWALRTSCGRQRVGAHNAPRASCPMHAPHQVFVRVKPLPARVERCMQMQYGAVVKAAW